MQNNIVKREESKIGQKKGGAQNPHFLINTDSRATCTVDLE